MAKAKVHILRDGRRIGPFDAEELHSRIQLAVIDPEELCSEGDDGEEITCAEWLSDQLPGIGYASADDELEESDEWDGDPGAAIWHGHPSIFHYAAPLLVSLGFSGAGLALLAWRFELWIGAALVAVGLALMAITITLRGTRNYLISERRVELLYGLLSKSSQEVLIDDIRAINVRKSGVKGLLGIGNVEFNTSGSSGVEVSFDNVSSANKVKQIVRELQDELEEG